MNAREVRIREFIADCQWQYRKVMPDSLRERVWIHAFDDIHVDRLSRAMDQHQQTSEFFPQPADIRKLAEALPPNGEEIRERQEYARQCREKLERQIEAARQWELDNPPRSALDVSTRRLLLAAPSPADRPALPQFTKAEYEARMKELEAQKLELLKLDQTVEDFRIEAEQAVTHAVSDSGKGDGLIGPEGLVM